MELTCFQFCNKMSYYIATSLQVPHYRLLSYHIMKLLIESLVFSHFTYTMSVWASSLAQQSVQHLQCLQNCMCCLFIVYIINGWKWVGWPRQSGSLFGGSSGSHPQIKLFECDLDITCSLENNVVIVVYF